MAPALRDAATVDFERLTAGWDVAKQEETVRIRLGGYLADLHPNVGERPAVDPHDPAADGRDRRRGHAR